MNILSRENPLGGRIFHKKTCTSTMTEILNLPKPLRHGDILFCDYQSKGRGRGMKRQWLSPPKENLLFSIFIEEDKTAHPFIRLPLVCGLAIREFLSSTVFHNISLQVSLKWPNDILVKGKKVAGILCEGRNKKIIAGMGLNCNQTSFAEEISKKATSLRLLTGKEYALVNILEDFLPVLAGRLIKPEWKAEAEAILYGKNQIVKLREGLPESRVFRNLEIRGLTEEGFLLALDRHKGQEECISSGELLYPPYSGGGLNS